MLLIVNTEKANQLKSINELLILSYIDMLKKPNNDNLILDIKNMSIMLGLTKQQIKNSCSKINQLNSYIIKIDKDNVNINFNNANPENTAVVKPLKKAKQVKEYDENTKQIAETVINFMNELLDRKYKPSTYYKIINARLNENYTLINFLQIMVNMYTLWIHTSYAQYLRPQTLFAPSHFNDYMNKTLGRYHIPRNARTLLRKYNYKLDRNNIIMTINDNEQQETNKPVEKINDKQNINIKNIFNY